MSHKEKHRGLSVAVMTTSKGRDHCHRDTSLRSTCTDHPWPRSREGDSENTTTKPASALLSVARDHWEVASRTTIIHLGYSSGEEHQAGFASENHKPTAQELKDRK